MNIALECAKRSPDEETKHGCIAVSQDGSILSTGYNGHPRGVIEHLPTARPYKYIWMEHSERNCIYNAARHGIPLKDCTFYVTGVPCVECMRGMYQCGATGIVYLDVECHSTTDDWHTSVAFYKKYISIRKFKYER